MTVPLAIVHDYLTQRGGAERVVLAMAGAFPGAPLYTTLYEPDDTYPEFGALDVRTSWLSRVPAFRRRHRLAFPLLAPTVSSWTVPADVVLCSSSGWAHAVRSPGARVVYCHAPARWLYQSERYVGHRRTPAVALAAAGPALRRWDRRAARRADRYLANSTVVAAAIRDEYGIDAEVVPPPVTIDPGGTTELVEGVEPGAFLCVSRLLPYKNVDAVVAAFATLRDERLVVVGDGPDAARLRASAPGNVAVHRAVSDAQLRWLYAKAAGLVAAAYEDFGLTPIEAGAFGRPVAVLRAGGYLDTVRDGETGVMFTSAEPRAIADAVRRLRTTTWDRARIEQWASQFSEARFAERLRAVVASVGG